MKNFVCQSCGSLLFFENTVCLGCGRSLGYLPDAGQMAAIEPAGGGLWRAAQTGLALYRQCHNYHAEHICNWMVPEEEGETFCSACRLNQMIPDLSIRGHRELWAKVEAAKRRMLFTLLRLGLPVIPKTIDSVRGLAFAFLHDQVPSYGSCERVQTGHVNGLITLNLSEADDTVRERLRLDLREVYRTLLGHFRHEIGHYYWDLLVRDRPDPFRDLFGDERADYSAALAAYYQTGPQHRWDDCFVSRYASAHPWEDWAESWAHYMHLMDTLETASVCGMHLAGPSSATPAFDDPFGRTFPAILQDWFALTFVINSLHRSMGLHDPYPFVLTPPIQAKLHFIHDCVQSCANRTVF